MKKIHFSLLVVLFVSFISFSTTALATSTDPYTTTDIPTTSTQEQTTPTTTAPPTTKPSTVKPVTDSGIVVAEKTATQELIAGLRSLFGLNVCRSSNWLLWLIILILLYLLLRRKRKDENK